MPTRPAPSKENLGISSLLSISGRQHVTHDVKPEKELHIAGRVKMSFATPLGEDSCNFDPDILRTSPHVPLPFVDVVLYLFAIINSSSEYNYILSPLLSITETGGGMGNP